MLIAVRRVQSARMPASRITLPSRAMSFLMSAANTSGVLPTGSKPAAIRRSRVSARLGDAHDFGVDLRDDVGGRALGQQHAGPRIGFVARQTLLGDGRNIAGRGGALGAGGAEHAQAAVAMIRQGLGNTGEGDRHLPRDEIVERRRDALVDDMHELDAGHRLQEFHRDVLRAADAARRVIQLAGTLFRERHQFLHRFRRETTDARPGSCRSSPSAKPARNRAASRRKSWGRGPD